jgi:hypothetical protein
MRYGKKKEKEKIDYRNSGKRLWSTNRGDEELQCFVQRRSNDRWWTIVTGRAPMMYRKHLMQRGSHVELLFT